MPLFNSSAGYGSLTKLFHWVAALLILLQYTSANIMLRTPTEGTTLGLSQGTYHNWHKLFLFVLARIAAMGADTDTAGAKDRPPHRATALWGSLYHAAEWFRLCHG
jgi:cytochrome b561